MQTVNDANELHAKKETCRKIVVSVLLRYRAIRVTIREIYKLAAEAVSMSLQLLKLENVPGSINSQYQMAHDRKQVTAYRVERGIRIDIC